MNVFRTKFVSVFLATVWISVSEFARNELLLKSYWVAHYQQMGLIFPSAPVNGAIWGLWSLFLALAIFFISRRFSLWQTTFIAWWTGFVMMWVVIGNLGALPLGIMWAAIPLSLLESFVAAWIVYKSRVNSV